MIKTIMNKLIFPASYIVLANLIEMVTFLLLGFGFSPKYFLYNTFFILFLASIIFILPTKKSQGIMFTILLMFQLSLMVINHSMYTKQSKWLFSFYLLAYTEAAGAAFDLDYVNFKGVVVACAFLIGIIVLLNRIIKSKLNYRLVKNKLLAIISVFLAFQVAGCAIFAVSFNKINASISSTGHTYLNNDKYLYETLFNKEKSLKTFGTFGMYTKEIYNIFTEKNFGESNNAEIEEYITSSSMSVPTDYFGALKGNNVIFVMIETGENYGIDPVLTPTLYAIKNQGIDSVNYYSKNKTNHSEALGIIGSYSQKTNMTDYFKAGTDNDRSVVPLSMPTILTNDGYNTNYLHSNSKEFYDREDIMVGMGFENTYFLEDMTLRPEDEIKDGFYDLDSDKMLFSTNLDRIVNTTDDKNFYSFITTLTMHGDFNDLLDHGDYAYNEYVSGNEISEEKRQKRAEEYNVNNLLEYYLEINDFSGTVKDLGVTYDFLEEKFGAVTALEVYYRYKRYQAAYMDLDRGIQILLEDLKEKGELDNTTLVLYADHNSYYHDQAYYIKGSVAEGDFELSDDQCLDLYNVPLMIYDGSMSLDIRDSDGVQIFHQSGRVNPKLPVGKLERFTTTFDLVPTFLDLLGYKYNTGLYLGTSIFNKGSVSETAFISYQSSYFTQNVYTHFDDLFYINNIPCVLIGEELYFQERDEKDELVPVESDMFLEFNESVDQMEKFLKKQEMFEKIYLSNYFLLDDYQNFDISKYLTK